MFPAGHALWFIRILWLVTATYGQRNQLTSKFISSCGSNGIDVKNFGITYHRADRRLEYQFIGAAQRPGLSAEIHVDVVAYGITAPTQIIEFCAVATCPLSQSGINVKGSQVLSASYADRLPAIAWTIPDLDAIATFTFGDNTTQLACLKASLSNGVTTQTPLVPWVTGAATIFIIVAAGVISAAGGLGSAGTNSGVDSGLNALPHAALSAVPTTSPPPLSPASVTPGGVDGGISFVPNALPPVPPSAFPPPISPSVASGGGHAGGFSGPNALSPTAPSTFHATASPSMSPISVESGRAGFTAGGAVLLAAMAGAGATTVAATTGAVGDGTAAQPHSAPQVQTQASSGDHGPPAGRMDPIVLFLYFQSISSMGLLSLRYPPIYQAFTVNFAWANFILPIAAFKLRRHIYGSAIYLMDNLLEMSGIQAYATRIGVPSQDIFGIVYLVYLCACAVLIALFFLVGLVMQVAVWTARTPERKVVWTARRIRWGEMASNNSLRIMMLALGTLATFSFYQWTQRCTSGITAFLSASALIIILANLGIVTFLIIRLAARPGGAAWLFSKDTTYGRRWGSLYNMLNETRVHFVVSFIGVVIVRSAITGFGQGHGLAQVIALLLVEIIMAGSLFYWQPYYSQGYNRVNYLLSMTKVISHVLLLLFVPSFNINLIGITVIGFILLVINSVVALVLVVLTVLKLGWGTLWFRSKHHAFERKRKRRSQMRQSYGSYDDGKVDESGLARPQSMAIPTT